MLNVHKFFTFLSRVDAQVISYLDDFQKSQNGGLDVTGLNFWKEHPQFLLPGNKRSSGGSDLTPAAQRYMVGRFCQELTRLPNVKKGKKLQFSMLSSQRQQLIRELAIQFAQSGVNRLEADVAEEMEAAFWTGQLDAELTKKTLLEKWPAYIRSGIRKKAKAESLAQQTAKMQAEMDTAKALAEASAVSAEQD